MKNTRSIFPFMKEDLGSRMTFIGGPRQVGKTTLAKSFLKSESQYLNWDDLGDRSIIKTHQIDPKLTTVVLDEIHKYSRWRMLLKGLYDKYKNSLSIIVTGSARLDTLRKGGDSLFGRYRYFRLHPFALHEVDSKCSRESTLELLKFGGFPEPLIAKSERKYRLWKRERLSRLVYQDLRDLDTVKDLSKIELLVDALPSKVGSVLSINSLKEDLEVSPNTVSHWLLVLETIYYSYRILPLGGPKIRAVKKSNKLYLWDWAEIESDGARFENFVASQLLYYCHFQDDVNGYDMELRFVRDTDLREIDFVVLKNKKPIFAVECKTGDKKISSHLRYFKERLSIPFLYQVHLGEKEWDEGTIKVRRWESFWKERVKELVAS
ncbi:ATP-binding protein [Leptospira ognonensis]|uniref:ATP-binding protein n=2 Tax=Leptospira ognonensis TaxID=2484945 RepID=A0A4R9JZ89_9LEPT|nr:ATP-binding protein [Leptospira ognonensis]